MIIINNAGFAPRKGRVTSPEANLKISRGGYLVTGLPMVGPVVAGL